MPRLDEKSRRGWTSAQLLCVNACRTSGQGGKARVIDVVWRVAPSASEERESPGSMGGRRLRAWEAVVFGAPHVERALAL